MDGKVRGSSPRIDPNKFIFLIYIYKSDVYFSIANPNPLSTPFITLPLYKGLGFGGSKGVEGG